jgi:tripartite-type tricarboxylate transporter receptor subunit TctC
MIFNRIRLSILLPALAGLWIALPLGSSSAQTKFPTRPINFYISAPPGGYFDLVTRPMCEYASKALGQPVVPINKAGAATTLAPTLVKAMAPDGYNISQISTAMFSLPPQQEVNYDPAKDFTYICTTVQAGLGIVVKADSPWKSIKDLASYAKANPGKVKYGTANPRGNLHFAMIDIAEREGIQWEMVPFLSGNDVVAALLGGHVQVISQGPEWIPHVEAGTMRLLAVVAAQRSKKFPDVPCTKELGYNHFDGSLGVVGPAGMPRPVVDILANTIKDSLKEPSLLKVLEVLDGYASFRGPDEYTKFVEDVLPRYRTFIDKNRQLLGLKK